LVFFVGLALGGLIATIAWRHKFNVELKPEPKLERQLFEVGDVLMMQGEGRPSIPVLLLEKLSFNNFRCCFVTPQAKLLGAVVGKDRTPKDELDKFLAMNVDDQRLWVKYPHELSDLELANIAKARLTQ
jgi:hypothetical protein